MYTKNDIQTAYDKIIEDGILGREDFQIAADAAMVMRGLKKHCFTISFLANLEKDAWIKFMQSFPGLAGAPYFTVNALSESGAQIKVKVIKRIGCLEGMDLTPDLLEGGYRVMSVRCLVRREVAIIKTDHNTALYRGDRSLAELEENLLLLTGLVKPE